MLHNKFYLFHLGYAWGVLLYLSDPTVHTLEAPLVCDVVNKEDSLSTSRVAPDDGAEPALAARIPDLQLDPLSVNQDSGCLIGCKFQSLRSRLTMLRYKINDIFTCAS